MDNDKYNDLQINITLHFRNIGYLELALQYIQSGDHAEAVRLIKLFKTCEQVRIEERSRVWRGKIPYEPSRSREQMLKREISAAIKQALLVPAGVR